MLRQIHILYRGERFFTHTFAMALREDDLKNVIEALEVQINSPTSGKILNRSFSELQVFHGGYGDIYFLMIADLVDSIKYMEEILEKAIKKFKDLFPSIEELKKSDSKREEYIDYLYSLQTELHSKITLIGPTNAGKTTLYELLTNREKEREIMNFAKSSLLNLYALKFEVWDFQLKDNFSLLWSKFISGSDLVIFIFDISNYNLKVLDYFLTLKRKESQLSKFLVIANKVDLVSDEEIKKLENELEIDNIEKLSLKDPEIKQKLISRISDTFNIKKKLPENFEDLIKEAVKFEEEKNLGKSLSKYKELINIANSYQHFSYLKEFQYKANKIEKKIREKAEIRRKIERKKKFAPPKKIEFTKQIKVKELPKNHKGSKEEKDFKNEGLIDDVFFTDSLEPDDVKIDLDKYKEFQIEEEKIVEKSYPEDNYKNINEVDDIPKLLQEMIKSRGSQLSLKLCSKYIEEMKSSLKRDLTIKDLKTAVDFFIKQEVGK
ncbi:MAG: ADP-ribosylation factor-like protein [Promethearchaeati archaeon]